MQVLPVRFDEVRVGDHLLMEYFSWQKDATAASTRLFVGGERVACHGFHVVEVTSVTLTGDDVTVNHGGGEVTSSVGNQTLRVKL